jgi:hypothetical protein
MTFATLRARFDTEFVMYRNFSFAAALLAAAFSGGFSRRHQQFFSGKSGGRQS